MEKKEDKYLSTKIGVREINSIINKKGFKLVAVFPVESDTFKVTKCLVIQEKV